MLCKSIVDIPVRGNVHRYLFSGFRRRFASTRFGRTTTSPPQKFLRYINKLRDDGENEETVGFLLHCPYLALRWNFTTTFVQCLDSWLDDITQPRKLKALTNPEAIPYLLSSLVRLHQRWSYVSQPHEGFSVVSARQQPMSVWTRVIHNKKFDHLLDQMVNIGLHRCDILDVANSCSALLYFTRNIPRTSNESEDPWPSRVWLSEFMNWIIRWLKPANGGEVYCDVSVGPILLATLCQFGDILPPGRYQIVLKVLADLSKQSFRDFVAERRSSSKRRLSSLLPTPQIFLHYSSSWLKWGLNPDDPDFAPGSWRVWYEALHYAGRDYAVIGSSTGKARNSFVVDQASIFAQLLVDMVAVARLFGKETVFTNTGAKGTWESWATLSAFFCEPAVVNCLLKELQAIEEKCVSEKRFDVLLPKEFIRPALRNHLVYLAGRDVEKLPYLPKNYTD